MKRLKKERFIKKKDKVIIQRVVEDMKSSSLGKRGIGLWASISKKIPNRSPDYIYYRWCDVQSKLRRVILLLEDIKNKKKKKSE